MDVDAKGERQRGERREKRKKEREEKKGKRKELKKKSLDALPQAAFHVFAKSKNERHLKKKGRKKRKN